MLHHVLENIALKARRVGSEPYAVCACGYGCVVEVLMLSKFYPPIESHSKYLGVSCDDYSDF